MLALNKQHPARPSCVLLTFGDTTALRERIRHFHVRHFRDGEVSHFLSPELKTRIRDSGGSCSRLRSRHTHGAGKPSARRLFTFSRSSGADRMPRKSNAGRPTIGLSLFICAKFQFSIQFSTESVLPIATQTDRRNNQNKYQFKILSREHWGLMIKILWLMNR